MYFDTNVYSYLTKCEIPLPATVYMTPSVKQYMSIACWKFAKDAKLILQPIPDSVFAVVVNSKLSIYDRIKPSFEKTVTDK